jgi:chemotaxis protein methyltransferase CheR
MTGARSRTNSDTLTREEFVSVRDRITGFCGIRLSDDYHARLQRVVLSRMRRCGMDTVEHYLRILAGSLRETGEVLRLVEEVANTETYFFREEFQLDALAEEILPELVDRRLRRRRLTLWSAGCSSGEEPFTLAMLLLLSPLWARQLHRWEIRILGTDINRRMIRRAREGRYRLSSFKGLPDDRRRSIQGRFFRAEGDTFSVKDELRELVSYLHLNLLDRDGAGLFGEMDIILCRNVLMYFPMEVRLQVLQGLYRKLAVGGYLLLGHSDNLLGLETPFEALRVKESLVYRKPTRRPGSRGRDEWGF